MSIDRVLELYGIKPETIKKHTESDEKAVWSINNEYILKKSSNEEEMIKNISLSSKLLSLNVPVQHTLQTLGGQDYVKDSEKFYALYVKIKGHTITDYFSDDYAEKAYYIGQIIGKLHDSLQRVDEATKEKMHDNNMINEVNGWAYEEIKKFLSEKNILSKEEAEKFNRLYKYIRCDFKQIYNTLPRQIIHRDMHGENLIFEDNKFKGFIDFDLSEVNARIYDPCYMCTAALSTVFNKEEERKKWPGFAMQIIRGYDDTVQLTDIEKKSIKSMMILIEIIMTAFFYKYGYKKIAHTNLKMALYIDKVISQ